MRERIVEILVYLMNEIQENRTIGEPEIADLKERGYTQMEISTAFSYLHEHFSSGTGELLRLAPPSAGSRRLLHDAEREAFSTEAQGLLIHLRELGLLDDRGVETVIERAMMTGYERLSVQELQGIVASVLFARGERGGAGMLVSGGDSIH